MPYRCPVSWNVKNSAKKGCHALLHPPGAWPRTPPLPTCTVKQPPTRTQKALRQFPTGINLSCKSHSRALTSQRQDSSRAQTGSRGHPWKTDQPWGSHPSRYYHFNHLVRQAWAFPCNHRCCVWTRSGKTPECVSMNAMDNPYSGWPTLGSCLNVCSLWLATWQSLAVPSHRSDQELAQTSESWHFSSQAKEKTKGKRKKGDLAELVLTVVIDGVGNQRRKGYRVVAVLVRKESLEAESDHVEVVLVDVVQLLLRHWRTDNTEGQSQNQQEFFTKLGMNPHQ